MNPLQQPVSVMRDRGVFNVVFETTEITYTVHLSDEDYKTLWRGEALMDELVAEPMTLADHLRPEIGVTNLQYGDGCGTYLIITVASQAICEITFAQITQSIANHLDQCKAACMLVGYSPAAMGDAA